MAQQLIDSLSADFDPSKFRDEYRDRVLDLIERKAAGEEIAVQPEAEDTTPAPDLMAALEASLAEIRSGDSDEPAKKPAAKKPAAKAGKSSSSNGSSGKGGSGSAKSGSGSKSAGSSKSSNSSKSGGASKSRAKAKT
jgi:DNA end-binding protein Ku